MYGKLKRVFFIVCLFFTNMAIGQNVKGTVKNEAGNPIPGTSVQVVNSNAATLADDAGIFNIAAKPDDTIIFSSVGYIEARIKWNGEPEISVIMELSTTSMSEVVVTALGIKKERKQLGYSVQQVKGSDVTKARDANGVGALTGKVAGLRITNTPNLYGNPGITLRGERPLIVVDGVPIASDSWNLSPDDIETYSVLKGPTASALYGSRGSDGAIEITTKHGSRNKKRFSIEFNSSNQLQTGFNAVPKVQQEYGPGSGGQYAFGDGAGSGVNDYDYFVWGPKFNVPDPNSPSGFWETTQWDSEYDPDNTYTVNFLNGGSYTSHLKPKAWLNKGKNNLKNYLRNGFLSTNNIAVSSSSEKADIRFSLSQTYQQGMVPNSDVNITNFNMSGGINFSEKLRLDANIAYNKQYTKNYPDVGYGPNSFIYNMFVWNGSNYDINEMRDYWQPGKKDVQQKWVEYYRYSNPWFLAYEQTRGYYNDNAYGFMRLNYKLTNDLSVYVRSYINSYSLTQQNRFPVSTTSYDPWTFVGGYEERISTYFENNTDALLTYNKKLTDFTLKASVGGNLRTFVNKEVYGRTNGGLDIPGLYTLSNSKEAYSPTSYEDTKQVQSLYGYADLGFKDYLFLSVTGRWDKSSSLPVSKNSYFYPSASLSLVISDMVKMPDAISLLKLRGSYANVGRDFDDPTTNKLEYNYINNYERGTRWNGNLPLYYPDGLLNPDSLLPSRTISYETGMEARFFKNRLGMDVAFFKTYDGPDLIDLDVSEASGYSTRTVSGGKTERRGWEITLNGTPIRKPNFSWDATINWSTYRKYLRELYGGQTVRDRFTKIGDRTDAYATDVFQRSPDGQIVFNPNNGYPLIDPYSRQIGWILPKWTGAIINTFRYKSISLNFQLDGIYGGKVYDQVLWGLWSGGNHPASVTKEREDEAIRGEATMVGKGVVVTSGEITYDGQGNVISDTREFEPNTKAAYYSEFARRFGTAGELTAVDKTFMKLREVVLSYNLPTPLIQHLKFFESGSISLIGRNLLYFSKTKDLDLDSVTGEADGTTLQTPSVKSFGLNINLVF